MNNQLVNKFKYFYSQYKKELSIALFLISFILIIFIYSYLNSILISVLYLILFICIVINKDKNTIYLLYLSLMISLIWNIIAINQYEYKINMLSIFGLNSFSLFAWAGGLFIIYFIYDYFRKKLKISNFIKKTILFLLIYWILLISAETIAYHVFNFKNIPTAIYQGLPICKCIHAPNWMKISYLSLGPIYFLLLNLFKLDKKKLKK
jgi:hypothetical protein